MPAPPILSQRLLPHFLRRMNISITLQQPVDVDDGQGGKTRTWGPLVPPLTVDAAIEALSGMERLAEGGPQAVDMYMILIAYIPGIDPTMRVQYGTRTFDIQQVTDYGEQHLLIELLVQERFRK